MPGYPWLLKDDIDFASIQPRVDAMLMLGVPYGEYVNTAEKHAQDQAEEIAANIVADNGPDLRGKDIIALIAYLQRLGTDIKNDSKDSGGDKPVATR